MFVELFTPCLYMEEEKLVNKTKRKAFKITMISPRTEKVLTIVFS